MKKLRSTLDPVGVALATLTAAALLAIQEGPLLAILAGASVLAVAAGANTVVRRVRPTTAPTSPLPAAPPPPTVWYEPLTFRQSQIAALVEFSNKEIAARLGIGERGVEATIQNIFGKLSDYTKTEFHSRTQIAVWVKERQMKYGVPPATTPSPR